MRNLRRLMIAIALALVAVGVFIASSGAFSGSGGLPAEPPLPSDLPYQALPVVPLSSSDRARLELTLIPPVADRYGINDASYASVRQLAVTAVGPLLVVSGTTGVCVILAQSAACGNPDTADKRAVAVFTADASGHYVGGGILAANVSSVTVGDAQGTEVRGELVKGGFTVGSAASLSVSGPLNLSTN